MRGKGTNAGPLALLRRLASVIADERLQLQITHPQAPPPDPVSQYSYRPARALGICW